MIAALSANIPSPDVVHKVLKKPVAVADESVNVPVSQMVSSNPTAAVALGFTVRIKLSVTSRHCDNGLAVNVNVTGPVSVGSGE